MLPFRQPSLFTMVSEGKTNRFKVADAYHALTMSRYLLNPVE